jgi:regulatory protein
VSGRSDARSSRGAGVRARRRARAGTARASADGSGPSQPVLRVVPDDGIGEPGAGGAASEPEQASRQESDPESVARLICLRLLTAAPRTRAQLADALRRRGVPDNAAASVLARFAEVGLIDDAMFASTWVESRHAGRGLGRRALAAELNQRGVERADVQAAVDQLSPETELATARALVERKLASSVGQPAEVRVRRLAGMLARKGYAYGLAYRVVREALEQAGQETAAEGRDAEDFWPESDETEEAGAEYMDSTPD